MFFYVDLLWALLVALFITGLLVAGLRKARPAVRIVASLFIILLLGVWAGGLWLSPIGPPVLGGYVVAFFVAGIILALFIAVASYPFYPAYQTEERSSTPDRSPFSLPVSALFWLLLALLVVAIVAAYIWPRSVV